MQEGIYVIINYFVNINYKTCLPIELKPMKTGGCEAGAFKKSCNLVWAKHNKASLFIFSEEGKIVICAHSLHENCHSIGRFQKPQTWTFEGQ